MFFVSGATGFIGQRLILNLEGDVKILSRKLHSYYETVVCDLASDFIPENALDGVDTVFHLAGFAHDLRNGPEVEHLYRAVNVAATMRLAEMAVAAGVGRFIFVSSVKAGGSSEDNVEWQPEGVYGQTKREAELKLLDLGRQSEMHVSIVRPSLAYGEGVKGNLALMRRGIEQGWFPPIPETDNRRSMIHVDDLVRALLLVAEDKRANGKIFIATDGVPHSSREIYEAICKSVSKRVPTWSVPKYMFNTLSLLSPRIRYKVDKLLGDEYYSSKKLEALGFMAERTLEDWNDCE
jgi:nucleoside-diphosphate-sugar epimerase